MAEAVAGRVGRDDGPVHQQSADPAPGRPRLRRVLVLGGRGSATAVTDQGTRVEPLRVAWQLDEFGAALDAETDAEVRVLDDIGPGDVVPGTAVIGSRSVVRTLSGPSNGSTVIELGVGSSTGLGQVEEAGLAGGIDFEAYRAWQRDRHANDRMFGRLDVAEHMGAHIALRSDAYCSFWLDGPPGLPRLVARYLEAYAALVGTT